MLNTSHKQIFWWLLATAVALRLYLVRELLAALSLFTLAFVAVALVASSLYMLQKLWTSSITRFTGL